MFKKSTISVKVRTFEDLYTSECGRYVVINEDGFFRVYQTGGSPMQLFMVKTSSIGSFERSVSAANSLSTRGFAE